MISFDIDQHRFNLRAAAVVLHGDSVLLHKVEGDAFWSVPGGRVNAGEIAADAVVREMHEELSEAVVCGRLLWIVENFFVYRQTRHHEIGLYFLVSLQPGSRLLNGDGPFFGAEGDLKLTFRWFKLDALPSLDVRPSLLAGVLADRSLSFRHLVHDEPESV